MRHRIGKAGLAMVLAMATANSCGDISHPSRIDDFYDWRLVVGVDSLSFHWAPALLPVRVWVEDTLGLPAHAQAGIEIWKRQFLYGEFDAVLVADSTTADILLGASVSSAPKAEAVRLGSLLAPECTGVTSFPPIVDSIITLPFRIRITPRTANPDSPAATACFGLTVAHELGHAMGLFRHSSDAGDIMFFDPVAGPSTRDRNTIQQLYHFPADLKVSR